MSHVFAATPRPTHSPWGQVDQAEQVAPGIWVVYTPGHGGYQVSNERRFAMPEHLKTVHTYAGGNWFEEDCDWCIVALAFPDAFPPSAQDGARRTLATFEKTPDYAPPNSVYHKTMRAAALGQKLFDSQRDLFAVPA